MNPLPQNEFIILKILLGRSGTSPTGISRLTGISVSTVVRVLRQLAQRGIVRRMRGSLESQDTLSRGQVMYELTNEGKIYAALALELTASLNPIPLRIETALRKPTFRARFRKIRHWLEGSIDIVRASMARASLDYKKIKYSRQIETFSQELIYGTLPVKARNLSLVGEHETSQDEIDLLLDKTDLGLLTRTHVERMLARNDRATKCLVALSVYVDSTPCVLSTFPENRDARSVAYLAETTQRRLLAEQISKTEPTPVDTQNQLILGHIDGDYPRIVAPFPVNLVFKLEDAIRHQLLHGGEVAVAEAIGAARRSSTSWEDYILVVPSSSLENGYVRSLALTGVDLLNSNLSNPARTYAVSSQYIMNNMQSDMKPLGDKLEVMRELERLKPVIRD